jgi:hypothetical protein
MQGPVVFDMDLMWALPQHRDKAGSRIDTDTRHQDLRSHIRGLGRVAGCDL